MSALSGAVVAAVVLLLGGPRVPRSVPWLAGAVVVAPWLLPVGFATEGVRRVVVRHRARVAAERAADADLATLGRLVLVAVSAGLPIAGSLDLARGRVGPPMADELAGLLRRSSQVGTAEALRTHDGAATRLALLLARAHTTGASVVAAVEAFVEEQRDEQRTRALEAARRLPVKLTIPLALLILPGFVVLTVGPAVLESARRLLGPVFPVP